MTHFIDHERLAAVAHGNTAAKLEVLADFRRVNTQDAALLHQSAQEGDFAQVHLLAHRIKGASMTLGAVQFAETCSLVTMAGRAGDPAAIREALVFFERGMAELNDHLDGLCSGAIVAPALPSKPPIAQEHAMLCSNLKFLVVEDHAFQRDIIVRFLRRLGAKEVHGFGDGGSALAALNARAADIMVLDLSMPGMDGMDLMRTLSSTRHRISLILNSALSPSLMASLVQIARGYRLSLLGAVSKPLTESSLAPLIAKYRSERPDAAALQSETAVS